MQHRADEVGPEGEPDVPFSVDAVPTEEGLVVHFEGELDLRSAAWVRAAIDSWPVGPDTSVDLSALAFVDSMGIGCLMKLQRRVADAGGILICRGATPSVRHTLEMTGMHRQVALLD